MSCRPLLFALVASAAVALVVGKAAGADSPAFVDQFRQPRSVAGHRGEVVVLVSGGRAAADDCRRLGEALHVAFHPTAAGLSGAAAATAPVRPLATALDGHPGTPGPNVRVIAVARTGFVPGPLRGLVCDRFAAAVPDVPVWIDFDDALAPLAGPAGDPCVTVFDTAGRHRFGGPGPVDDAGHRELVAHLDALRREVAGRE